MKTALSRVAVALSGNYNNPTIQKIAEKLIELRGDIIAISSIVAGIALVLTFIFDFILSSGDSKKGWDRVKTILIAYACIIGVTFILGFVDSIMS